LLIHSGTLRTAQGRNAHDITRLRLQTSCIERSQLSHFRRLQQHQRDLEATRATNAQTHACVLVSKRAIAVRSLDERIDEQHVAAILNA